MINTRLSIFETLRTLIREISKHGDLNPKAFKVVLYAVILNDMVEWAQYYPVEEDIEKLKSILEDYIQFNSEFHIERFVEDYSLYRNPNTPQDHTNWSRIWDLDGAKYITTVTKKN